MLLFDLKTYSFQASFRLKRRPTKEIYVCGDASEVLTELHVGWYETGFYRSCFPLDPGR